MNQEQLEIRYSKYQLIRTIEKEFKEALSTYKEDTNFKFYCSLLCQMYLHKQANVETIVGILSPKYGTPQEVANKLYEAVNLDLLDYNFDTKRLVLIYSLTPDIEEMLELYQYPLPSITKPKKVRNNFQTGYITIKNPIILNGSSWFSDKDVCLDHINKANSVPLTLSKEVINSVEFSKPKRKSGEDADEYKKRVHQAKTFYTSSKQVMNELLSTSDKLYLTHRYDRRGRCYSSGYHVNPQGTDYNKAVLELVNKEIVSCSKN